MPTLQQKYETFRHLHTRPGTFVMPNPWNIGTAMMLDSLGFEALATTSSGYAFSIGQRDSQGALSRDQVLENAADIVSATDLPVSADLEDGFGSAPEACAKTITQAMQIGLVGGSIEDTTGNPDAPIHDFDISVERVRAAAEACKGKPFLLTARAENFINGRPDLEDTIARIQAFAEAGADVVYAPGLPDLPSVARLCRAVERPVNVLMGLNGPAWSLSDLGEVGVKRVSVGGSFARAALGAMMRAAREVRDHGTFSYAQDAIADAEAAGLMAPPPPPRR